ncbi:hypothetical protein EG328_004693 [Venturia inaequalis]|uniref:Uncharacterized protein n=1 Tax=Venturia inaequalis TaxID=5025 RepID=A0A8H3YTA2_VENIN|nr:hypothetical protein EG328_004693 [Venturia inaequalis]
MGCTKNSIFFKQQYKVVWAFRASTPDLPFPNKSITYWAIKKREATIAELQLLISLSISSSLTTKTTSPSKPGTAPKLSGLPPGPSHSAVPALATQQQQDYSIDHVLQSCLALRIKSPFQYVSFDDVYLRVTGWRDKERSF